MSNVNNQFKELINEAIHNFFHDDTELEMILKDWLYGICEQASEYEAKAKAFDKSLEAIGVNLKSVRSDYGGFTLNVLKKERVVTTENVLEAMELLMVGLLEYYESGERNAKKNDEVYKEDSGMVVMYIRFLNKYGEPIEDVTMYFETLNDMKVFERTLNKISKVKYKYEWENENE